VKLSGFIAFAWALIGALGLALVMNWCSGRGREAERAAAVARADTLEWLSDSLIRAHAADSAATADTLAKIGARLDALARAENQQVSLARVLARQLSALPDTMVPKRQALTTVAAKDSAIHLLAARVFTLVADTVQLHTRWIGAMREAGGWRQVALAAQGELKAANQRSAPKRFGCTGGATAMVGLVGTGGAGVGITCGVRVW
jgi:hypothetical protein